MSLFFGPYPSGVETILAGAREIPPVLTATISILGKHPVERSLEQFERLQIEQVFAPGDNVRFPESGHETLWIGEPRHADHGGAESLEDVGVTARPRHDVVLGREAFGAEVEGREATLAL